MVRKLKNFLKNWRKFLFGFLTIWIIYLNLKVHYLEYLNHKQLSYNANEYNNSNDEEKENLQQTIDALKSQNKISNKDYKSLFQDIFWDVGTYVPDVPDEMNRFYNFGDCYSRIYPSYFTSTRYIFYDRENTFDVYVYNSNRGPVWSPYEIKFKTYKEKKQKH